MRNSYEIHVEKISGIHWDS